MKWVLVLEPSEVDREYLKKIIARLGYRMFAATSGEEALRFMNQSLPDTVIVGECAPDYSAMELGQTIRDDRILSTAPMLLMTSNRTPSFQEKAGQAGYCEVVQRPMSIRKFYTSLEMCLSNNRRQCIRAPMSFPVNVKYEETSTSMMAHNFGEGGIYLPTPDPPPGNTEMDLEFKLPGLRNEFRFRGQVVHAQDWDTDDLPAGMGVKFLDIQPAVSGVLRIFMENFLVKRMALSA